MAVCCSGCAQSSRAPAKKSSAVGHGSNSNRMLEQVDEHVYFAMELAAHFRAAGNAVMSSVDEAENDAVEVTA